MYLLVSCQNLHVFAGIMSVYACMCSYYETITPKMSKYEMYVCACMSQYVNVSAGINSESACMCLYASVF